MPNCSSLNIFVTVREISLCTVFQRGLAFYLAPFLGCRAHLRASFLDVGVKAKSISFCAHFTSRSLALGVNGSGISLATILAGNRV